jgi:hypothetical protein
LKSLPPFGLMASLSYLKDHLKSPKASRKALMVLASVGKGDGGILARVLGLVDVLAVDRFEADVEHGFVGLWVLLGTLDHAWDQFCSGLHHPAVLGVVAEESVHGPGGRCRRWRSLGLAGARGNVGTSNLLCLPSGALPIIMLNLRWTDPVGQRIPHKQPSGWADMDLLHPVEHLESQQVWPVAHAFTNL